MPPPYPPSALCPPSVSSIAPPLLPRLSAPATEKPPEGVPWEKKTNLRVLFENRPALYFCNIIYLLLPIKYIFFDSVPKILFKRMKHGGIQHTYKFFFIFLVITKIQCWPVFKQEPNLLTPSSSKYIFNFITNLWNHLMLQIHFKI